MNQANRGSLFSCRPVHVGERSSAREYLQIRRLAIILPSLLVLCVAAHSQGIISTVAGNGQSGYSGDGGAATSAKLNAPNGVGFDASGNLYVFDAGNLVVRKISAGMISSVSSSNSISEDGGGVDAVGDLFLIGVSYLYKLPVGSQNLLFVADEPSCCSVFPDLHGNVFYVSGESVVKIRPDGTPITTATLNASISALTGDAIGNLYAAVLGNHTIRKIDSNGVVTTIAGNGQEGFSGDGGAATSAKLDSPHGVAIDGAGNLYIADTNNLRIRMVNPAGTISTVAGNGFYGFSGDGGSATNAMMTNPAGIAVDAGGNVYFADTSNNRIRKITAGVSGIVGTSSVQALAGTTATIPISLNLTTGTAASLSFSLVITPVGGAPALTGTLAFQQASGLTVPDTIDTGVGSGTISVFWSSIPTPLTGNVAIGNVSLSIPATASIGQTYSLQITGASGSAGTTAVVLGPSPNGLLTVALDYLVGDALPNTGDSAGSFGDSILNTLDLIAALRAVTNLPGFRPQSCTDRFDAMDAFPVDAPSVRGGDGFLNTLDLIETLKRITNIDASRPRRVSRALTCPTAQVEALESKPGEALRTAGNLVFGETEAIETGVRIPVYLETSEVLSLAAFSFSLGDGRSQLSFVAGTVGSPSIVDTGVPGAIAVAWLSGFGTLANRRILLGYVRMPSGVDLTVYGVNANAQSDGSDVSLGFISSRKIGRPKAR